MQHPHPILELRTRLRRTTQKALADDLGLSKQYLCDVLRGRREPGPKILSALKLERVVTYRRKTNGYLSGEAVVSTGQK